MLTRRDLMKSAGLTVALGAVPATLAARANDLNGWVVVADPKQPESMTFAGNLGIRGATIMEFSGRTDALWYRSLKGICTADVRPPLAGLIDRQRAYELRMFGENVLYVAAQRDFLPLTADSLESFVLAPMNSRRIVRL